MTRPIAHRRILVANRGEIAIRILRAATELSMKTVAIYSHEDRFSTHRFKADEAYCLGTEGKPLDAYLDWQNLIAFAVKKKIDVIHPGYGFLSENSAFAKACEDHGILFCGPGHAVLDQFGDKLKAKQAAIAAGIPVIPGTDTPLATKEEAISLAGSMGYPVTLKAISGGGGKGIRKVSNDQELGQAFDLAKSEAQTSFGRADIYLEKTILKPRHIEVQVAGAKDGTILHFYERDCSIQRRHQKVVEIAPAVGISPELRAQLCADAVKVASHVGYVGVGTVEFLVDRDGQHYFLEVNPRIQVEHTVTEMVTGLDLVIASIMLPAGRSFSHPAMGLSSQEDVRCQGVAIQCRITTEDPLKNFAPDIGKIIAYRPAHGFGIRLDEGLGTSGGTVTPHFDSLLVKVTAHGRDMLGAARKMQRALMEFRIRGVKHNIPLLANIVRHEAFINYDRVSTDFFTDFPEVFKFKIPKDRATKILKYIGNATVNNPHMLSHKEQRPKVVIPELPPLEPAPPKTGTTAKLVFDQQGSDGLVQWIKDNPRLLLTDTTLRDAHQSLFATRLRNIDMFRATEFYQQHLDGLFSCEVWGGATFDVCLRFLKEDPWQRLASLREQMPGIMLQMLFRGDNAVGYTNYPKWVIKDFIRLTAESGLDVFRIFDCLNNISQMTTAIEEVKKHGKIAEGCVCYTGNILDAKKSKYSLSYYLERAKELESAGVDILCIKDMAGLLRPKAAEILIRAIKDTVDLPIHLHTHATSGTSEAMLLGAARAGCDIVDGAVSSMSGLTSQASLNAVVASLEGEELCPRVPMAALDEVSKYFEAVRAIYHDFDPGVKATTTRVYHHEIPGGQYSNLFDQARKVGLSTEEFHQLTERYHEVNQLFGDLIKVTPSSKVVGDMALLLQKNKLTADSYLATRPHLDYPDSVVSFFKGHMGLPYGGFPEQVRAMVLGEDAPPPQKIEVAATDSLESVTQQLTQLTGQAVPERLAISYKLYPQVTLDYLSHDETYGDVSKLPTDVFFYGLDMDHEITFDIEPGKTLILSLSGMSKPDSDGKRKLFFQLNGFARPMDILDENVSSGAARNLKADPLNPGQLGAPMPGKILAIKVAKGDHVEEGTVVAVTEAMKMEYAITTRVSGTVAAIHLGEKSQVEEGDLIIDITPD